MLCQPVRIERSRTLLCQVKGTVQARRMPAAVSAVTWTAVTESTQLALMGSVAETIKSAILMAPQSICWVVRSTSEYHSVSETTIGVVPSRRSLTSTEKVQQRNSDDERHSSNSTSLVTLEHMSIHID
eukprot:Protomagalhaensia_sp_Gyna_25__2779@NODE_2601_length_987_cov_18_739451_g2162_i0_p2_GENE_NODE_2601_length_987_cov_18_739451_g2162_i0NODE_2601_length_987_cov_18_739451_g2162_i0_p2_ORF_typecomplete_len128_score8_71PEPCK_GTP/PF00821_18/0_1_NODE_2601_length_987_cov_18_739451_g2162_i0170553